MPLSQLSTHSSQRAPRPRRSRGFALLITLTLLAFVVLLLVGLASYTKIETAVAGNFQKQAQARQNAQLALDLALAQLQKHAGPDTRVTATADSFGGSSSTRHYAGVWDAIASGADPVSWLVSGNELNPLARTPTAPGTGTVELVGRQTTGAANAVLAPLVALTSVGVPGQAGATAATIGRYAWWIGDQGVKAPVGLRDTTDGVDYAPFDSAELRSRIRQQISLGAGPANFEPRDAVNALLVPNLKAANQLAFLRTPGGTAVGLATLQANFAAWSPNNFNVLADTAGTGLKRDLSIDPSLLGASAQAWLDYTTYMESPEASAISAFPPIPAITPESLRRRYVMQPGPPAISPVLSFFLLSFNVRTEGESAATRALEVRAFWKIALWNPYTASFVPESNLRVEVTGLPQIRVINDEPSGGVVTDFSLQSLFSGGGVTSPFKMLLPWDSTAPADRSGIDRLSWLPGRVYNWRSIQELSGAVPPDGYPSQFYSKSYTAPGESNGGVVRGLSESVDGDAFGHLEGTATTITVKIFAQRSGGDVPLAEFESQPFSSFATNSRPFRRSSTQFVYVFRLREGSEAPKWLASEDSDPRQLVVPKAVFAYGAEGESPAAYAEDFETSVYVDRLLDRSVDSLTYNEDAPVFELPRGPLLSMGALQHLALPGARPFSVGNSWGATADINGTPAAQLFDRFFFSGLTPTVTPSTEGNALVLPNPLLRVAPRLATGTSTTVEDLRTAPTARSSKLLLQGGAFNVNSTNVAAWAAVLRSVRFPAAAFNYLDADGATGTAAETGETPATVQSGDAQFFRFSQSAQETYKAEPGFAAGAGNTSAANTHLFRQGMVTLDADKVTALAAQIVALVRARHAASGPFRSLAEFLSPAQDTLDAAGGQISLLEKAIADAAINVDAAGNPIEFSSQFLTQGDIMTALAPVLFPRSDTFVIRTYGEAVNPATGATEGRAWAEATVQRTPEYFDPADDATLAPADLTREANKTYGRRFKVVSFRWLTRADL
ncbi:MAG: hypothetical protein B9S26_05270 [Opitutia bacterium Tous-C4FEB]|nr:MAG: hypothetical protein B9S35_05365 [Opitutae bacterium Tous-C5TDCM]PAW90093.1 MAG: hypothetical protein B9S26_05270 [Opitutae bacterium Tous-C4FEB]